MGTPLGQLSCSIAVAESMMQVQATADHPAKPPSVPRSRIAGNRLQTAGMAAEQWLR